MAGAVYYVSILCCAGLITGVVLQAQEYDLCKEKVIKIDSFGKNGTIKFDGNSLNNSDRSLTGCLLKIEACNSCRIEIIAQAERDLYFPCADQNPSEKYCVKGCEMYLYIFDMFYVNETITYYRSITRIDSRVFRSASGSVFIMLCHNGMQNYPFSLKFSILEKMQTVIGSSDTYTSVGWISSPYFPSYYAQNYEVYKYYITSRDEKDIIQLTFDDWYLSDASTLYVDGTSRSNQFFYSPVRPVIQSDKNWLKILFSTGLLLPSGENRNFIGFRASYRVTSASNLGTIPKTDCGSQSYYMDSVGGKIEFSPLAVASNLLYDCLWVMKPRYGFDGIYLRIIRFTTNGYVFRGENQLTIREGIASTGPVVEIRDILDNINNGISLENPKGFYIRLNATMRSSDQLLIAFASYKHSPGCGGYMFGCGNGRCIDSSLKCDGIDHCGDMSDERQGCRSDDENYRDGQYQYTITIGVIIPVVISVFLVMVICLLFVMIRRCRRARLQQMAGHEQTLPTVSENVSRRGERRRRRRRGFFEIGERDLPPSYEQAIQNPPGWYRNVDFINSVDPTLPQPPSYQEAITESTADTSASQTQPPGSPSSAVSSQSELTVYTDHLSDSSSSDDDGSAWETCRGDGEGRRGRLGRHGSSSVSDTDIRSEIRLHERSQEPTGRLPSSVVASRQSLQSSDVERARTYENTRIETSDSSVNNRISKKENDDDFVEPSESKPGESNEHIICGRGTNSTDPVRQHTDPQSRAQQESVSSLRPVKQESEPNRPQPRTHPPTSLRQHLEETHAAEAVIAPADRDRSTISAEQALQQQKKSQSNNRTDRNSPVTEQGRPQWRSRENLDQHIQSATISLSGDNNSREDNSGHTRAKDPYSKSPVSNNQQTRAHPRPAARSGMSTGHDTEAKQPHKHSQGTERQEPSHPRLRSTRNGRRETEQEPVSHTRHLSDPDQKYHTDGNAYPSHTNLSIQNTRREQTSAIPKRTNRPLSHERHELPANNSVREDTRDTNVDSKYVGERDVVKRDTGNRVGARRETEKVSRDERDTYITDRSIKSSENGDIESRASEARNRAEKRHGNRDRDRSYPQRKDVGGRNAERRSRIQESESRKGRNGETSRGTGWDNSASRDHRGRAGAKCYREADVSRSSASGKTVGGDIANKKQQTRYNEDDGYQERDNESKYSASKETDQRSEGFKDFKAENKNDNQFVGDSIPDSGLIVKPEPFIQTSAIPGKQDNKDAKQTTQHRSEQNSVSGSCGAEHTDSNVNSAKQSPGGKNQPLHQSYLSLNSALEDMEDVFV